MSTDNDVQAVYGAYIADAAKNGVKLTQDQATRLRTAISQALAAGVGQDRLVRIEGNGQLAPAGLGFQTGNAPAAITLPGGKTLDLSGGTGAGSSFGGSVDFVIKNIEDATPEASERFTGGSDPAVKAALEEFGVIPSSDEGTPRRTSSNPGAVSIDDLADSQWSIAAAMIAELSDPASYAGLPPEDAAFLRTAGQESLAQAVDIAFKFEGLRSSGTGYTGDGQVITSEMLADPDPIKRAQAAAAFTEYIGGTIDTRNQLMAQLGLDEFIVQTDASGRSAAAAEANAQAQQSFANDLARLGAQLDVEDATSRRVQLKLDRELSGKQESRARSELTLTSILDSLPLSSPAGKTAFTANELGAGVGQLALLGGINPDANLIQYTGQQRIAPQEVIAGNDQALGVTGPLTSVPDLQIGLGNVPGTPQFSSSYAGAGAGGSAPGNYANIPLGQSPAVGTPAAIGEPFRAAKGLPPEVQADVIAELEQYRQYEPLRR